MTDNDAAKALDALNSIELSSCEVWDQTVDIYDLVDKDTIETIRAALVKSAKVGGLLEALEHERDAIFYLMTRGGHYDMGLAKERMTKAIQRYNGEG